MQERLENRLVCVPFMAVLMGIRTKKKTMNLAKYALGLFITLFGHSERGSSSIRKSEQNSSSSSCLYSFYPCTFPTKISQNATTWRIGWVFRNGRWRPVWC